MGGRYEHPTPKFPYKITRRLNAMARPRRIVSDTGEGMPAFTPSGVRVSALRGHATDRITDAALPYMRRFLILKRLYKNKFSPERLERIEHMIEMANSTIYSKLANCVMDLKGKDTAKDTKKKRIWSDSEWKKHMDYINLIAGPRRDFEPPPVKRGKGKPLEELMPRIQLLSYLPEFKLYKRMSQEAWYRDNKVSRAALKYQITDSIKKLAAPRSYPPQE